MARNEFGGLASLPLVFFGSRGFPRFGLDLTVGRRSKDGFGCSEAMVPAEFREVEAGGYVEPSIRLSDEDAQALVDELWRCGYRPTEGTGSAGSLAATERHLGDLRAVAFAALEKVGVRVGDSRNRKGDDR